MKRDVDALNKRVRELCRQDRHNEAKSVCYEYLQNSLSDSERANVLHTLAYAEKSSGNIIAGIAHLKEAKRANPTSRAVLHSLADAFMSNKSFEEVIDTCNALIRLDSQFPHQSFTSSAYLQMAYAHWHMGSFDKAKSALEKCEHDEPVWIDEGLVSKKKLFELIKSKNVIEH